MCRADGDPPLLAHDHLERGTASRLGRGGDCRRKPDREEGGCSAVTNGVSRGDCDARLASSTARLIAGL